MARGKRAPRAPSIVDGFCRLPSLAYAVGSAAPDVCPLVLVAGPVPLAAMHEDVQNDNRLATTPDGPEAVRPVGKWPRYGGPEQPGASRTLKFTRSIKAVFNRPEKPNPCRVT